MATVFILAGSPVARAQGQTNSPFNENSLSPFERELLNEINQTRTHPDEYAGHLEELKPRFNGKEFKLPGRDAVLTEEGWAAAEDAISYLCSIQPASPLTLSRGLYLAAQQHVNDQGPKGSTGHKGSDGSMVEERIARFGTWDGAIGEDIFYGDQTARERILLWLIDDGVPSRGHRKRLVSPDYKFVGVSCGPHVKFGTMCVITFAGGFSEKTGASQATKLP